jgi:hypothetical protein
MRTLRVGVMLDGWVVPGWVASIAADLAACQTAEIAAVVLNGSTADQRRALPRYRPRPNPFRPAQFTLYLDQRLFHPTPDALAEVDLRDPLSRFPIVAAAPRFDGASFRLSEPEMKRLRDLNLDVLLLFWPGLPADQVLTLARYGVWTFLDQQRQSKGEAPVGFSEVLTQHPFVVQCLRAHVAGSSKPVTVYQHHGPTDLRSIRLCRNNLLLKSVPFVSRALARLQQTGSLDAFGDEEPCGGEDPLGTAPSSLAVLTALTSHVYRFAHDRFTDIRYFEQWVMAYKYGVGTDLPDRRFAGYQWVFPPKDRSWADPFPVQFQGQDWVFFEEVPFSSNRGRLAVAGVGPNGLTEEPKVILEREYHLSYPFVFRWQGDWYLIPETQEANRIDVYKFDAFPYQVSFHKTLMENVRAVDTTLLEADGRWWMFVGITPPGTLNVDELFLFYADSPFGAWIPHRSNPIRSDIRCARPAGRVFERDGKYYRPGQDCSHRYGYAVRLYEIKVLTPSDYVEEEVGVMAPDGSPGMLATHTINTAGSLSVIDAKMRRRK